MRLADFILKNIEPILQQWEDFAKTMTPAANDMDSSALRDHAEQMLLAIAADLRTAQSPRARIAKSHGKARRSGDVTPAETHADIRHSSGFSIGQMISEYRALRTSVLVLWMSSEDVTKEHEISDIVRFNEAVDQALAESVVSYGEAADVARNVFLGILGHDLRSPLGAILYRGSSSQTDDKCVAYLYERETVHQDRGRSAGFHSHALRRRYPSAQRQR